MKKITLTIILILATTLILAKIKKQNFYQPDNSYKILKLAIIKKYSKEKPKYFVQWFHGIKHKFKTDKKEIALTFDACGGPNGNGYDKRLINLLIKENIPATLFISGRWLKHNKKTFIELSNNQLFEIGNHGLKHRPLSANGKSKYKIKGTKSVGQVVNEVELNGRIIEKITGKRPLFFRSGTAYYDDVALKILKELNYIPVNFTNIVGDAEKKYSYKQIAKRILYFSKPGRILLFHMNHPQKTTYRALKIAIPILKKRGFRFVNLKMVKDALY